MIFARLERSLLGLALCAGWCAAGFAQSAPKVEFDRKEDVIYGRKFGTALTLDVITPRANANGAGVIWVISGGWFSNHDSINPATVQELLRRGYTVFAVVHGSQPRFTIPEVVEDMNRAVRFIRHHAAEYHVDPNRLGITGGSAGGHLSLMIGLAGNQGNKGARDPVDRESSRVQAVACFFPPTDFLNYGAANHNAVGRGVLKGFRAPFDFSEFDRAEGHFKPVVDEARVTHLARAISPAYHVSRDDPPTLIIHGDADTLVPIQQAELVLERLKKAGVETKLVVKKGAGHGWPNLIADMSTIADWFDAHLAAGKAAAAGPARAKPGVKAPASSGS